MANYNNIELTVDDGIAIVTIARPKVLNALSWETVAEIKDAAAKSLGESDIVGLILTSQGGAIAGADIRELATVKTNSAGVDMCRRGGAALEVLESSDKPVVAAVNGPVLGGGCEISMACHARVVGPKLLLGQPEVNLGIIPGYGGTQRLPRLIGPTRAADLLRTGRPIKSQQACDWGWSINPQPVDDVLAEAKAVIRRHISGQTPVHRVSVEPLQFDKNLEQVDIGHHSRAIDAILVQVIKKGWSLSLQEGLEEEALGFGRCIDTEDNKIGMSNFIENGPRAKADFVHR